MQLFKSKKVSKLEQELKSLKDQIAASLNSNRIQTINDSIAKFPDWSITDTTNKYATSDNVNAVISKIAGRSTFIPVYPYIKKDDTALKKYQTAKKADFYPVKSLFDLRLKQIKALVDAPENDDLSKLLNEPNPYQSKNDFFFAAYVYYLLNGECIIWKERLSIGANGGKVKRLHIWAPDQVVIRVTRQYPQTILGYDFVVNGQTITTAPVTDVIHWKQFNPGRLCFGQEDVRGLSPLKPLTNTITRMQESDLRSVSMIKNGGTPGIVYDKSISADELSQEAFDAQKKAYYDHLTNPSNAGAPFFTGSEKGYISTGLNMVDLQLLELGKVDFKRLCAVYKISDKLFDSPDASTFNNLNEMTKQMILNACLPMIHSFTEKLNRELANEFDRVLDVDISDIPELQDNMKEQADAIAAMPAAPSVNEQREIFNYEAIGDKEDETSLYNKPLIKQGYMFIEDVGQTDISIQDLQP